MINKRIKKKIKTCLILGTILGVGVLSFKFYSEIGNRNSKYWEKTEEVKYEIGGDDSNYVIRSSIVGGCNLNQYLKGENLEEYDSDVNGKVYRYEDSEGVTYVYEGIDGKINSINQECKYSEETWLKILKFWETLGNTEKNYLGYESTEEIDWNDEDIYVEFSGSSDYYEYVFSRYPSYREGSEDGNESGIEGTAISISITEIEGDIYEEVSN